MNKGAARLGVNIDHVATVRQARRVPWPEPVAAGLLAELAGADQITVHLRSDRRHIQDRDLPLLKACLRVPLNVEMAATAEMVGIARSLRPHTVTWVPERQGEVTTEGGLNLSDDHARAALTDAVATLGAKGIQQSLFIDPSLDSVERAASIGATIVELNTAAWSEAEAPEQQAHELLRIEAAAARARALGIAVAAGHGLHYENVGPLHALGTIEEFNIGHALIGRAILVGLDRAVRDMKDLLRGRG